MFSHSRIRLYSGRIGNGGAFRIIDNRSKNRTLVIYKSIRINPNQRGLNFDRSIIAGDRNEARGEKEGRKKKKEEIGFPVNLDHLDGWMDHLARPR